MTTFAHYVVTTALYPVRAMKRLLAEPLPIRRSVQAVGFVGALYALASLVLALAGAVPLAPVLVRAMPENYYFWQMILVIPYALLAWILAAGLIRLLGKQTHRGPAFEKTASLAGIAVAASLFVAWIPMALFAGLMAFGMGQEELADLLSRPGGWQAFYILMHLMAGFAAVVLLSLAAGQGHIRKKGWLKPVVSGVLAAAVVAGTFVLFVR